MTSVGDQDPSSLHSEEADHDGVEGAQDTLRVIGVD